MAKRAYRLCERNILAAATSTAKDVMNAAALVVKSIVQNVPIRQLENVEYPLTTDTWTFFRKSFFSNFIQGHWETSRLGNDVQVLYNSKCLVEHACSCIHLVFTSITESVSAVAILLLSSTRAVKIIKNHCSTNLLYIVFFSVEYKKDGFNDDGS
ncbi:hypothetical protein TNCT_42451 [Trichonephila clavata]|uniref:Uncharacterized protein n=1 Tax=Trichonephila clavata TaxID=2740835 RepID=A0A8X6GS52_TRICU|nr:hypothetical protein TNCT_42451 [Trichonephila clavata]